MIERRSLEGKVVSAEGAARDITATVLADNGIKGIAGIAVANQIVDSLAEVELIDDGVAQSRLNALLKMCDEWDAITKGETPATTKRIRDIALGREGSHD